MFYMVRTVFASVCRRKNAFIRVYLLPSVADFCPWLPLFWGRGVLAQAMSKL
jgi:hypothetical protein